MASDLTTWDHVRSIMGENNAPEGSAATTTINFLIKSASDMIRRETGRRFTVANPRVTQTRTVYAGRGGFVYLDEMISGGDITSVSGPAGVVASGEYRVEEESYPAMGLWLRLQDARWPYELARIAPEHEDFFTRNMTPPPGVPRQWAGQQVNVAGTWGYTRVPEEIDYLCARAVQIWWDTNVANYAQTASGDLIDPDRLPQAVMRQLRKWKRPKVGAAAVGA